MALQKYTKRQCSIEGCELPTYARGLCRKHYQIEWRAGTVGERSTREDLRNVNIDKLCRYGSLKRELKTARDMYDRVYGLESRVRWRREIIELEKLLARFEKENNIKPEKDKNNA